jgi:two-component system, LytTR family, sensor kinase
MYHGLEKSRVEEIKNLRWEASRNEIELNNLKSQLNPHFMFNSMNSIRALIDENPPRAKEAVTKLSTILRNTLMMGKKREVTLREELDVVRDYLDLEFYSIRRTATEPVLTLMKVCLNIPSPQ